jgi:hypothetical protein
MCPPDIYGKGSGPGKTQSFFVPMFVESINKIGAPFYAKEGRNVKSWVHIEDLIKVYISLVEAAVAGGKGADWGADVRLLLISFTAFRVADGLDTGLLLCFLAGTLPSLSCEEGREPNEEAWHVPERRSRGARLADRRWARGAPRLLSRRDVYVRGKFEVESGSCQGEVWI